MRQVPCAVRRRGYGPGMDTWSNRDSPVLAAIVGMYDESGSSPHTGPLAEATGLSEEEVIRAIRALEHESPPFLLDVKWAMSGPPWSVGTPTGHARRAVGAWPTAETLADRLVLGLNNAADQEQDQERQGWLRKTAAYLGSAGRDIAVDIAATAVNKQIGI